MYLLEYMIYHMRPFGVGHYTCPANMDAVWANIQPDTPALGQHDRHGKTAGVAKVGQAEDKVGGQDEVKEGDRSRSREVPAEQLMQM